MTTQHKWVMRMGCALRKCLPAPCLPAPCLPAPCLTHTCLTHTCLPTPPPITHITIAQQQINNAYNIIMQMDAKYNRQINKLTTKLTQSSQLNQSTATTTLNKHRIITLTQNRHNLHKYLQQLRTCQLAIYHIKGFRKLVFITLLLSSYLTLPPHCIIVRLNYGVYIL